MRKWYVAINTFTPGNGYGTVISSHKTYSAASEACRHAQPRERGSYLPTTIRTSERWFQRGWTVEMRDLTDPEEHFSEWEIEQEIAREEAAVEAGQARWAETGSSRRT